MFRAAKHLLLIASWLDLLGISERYALLKLVTGGLRIGVSARLAKQALADFGKVDVVEIGSNCGTAGSALHCIVRLARRVRLQSLPPLLMHHSDL